MGKKARVWLPVIPALAVLAIYATQREKPLHIDEIYWIGSSYYYDLAFHQGDPGHADWDLMPARENPQLGRYLIGAWLDAFGARVRTIDLLGTFYLGWRPELGHWGEGVDYQKRKAVADRVDPDVASEFLRTRTFPLSEAQHRASRRLMVGLGMIAAAMLVVIGIQCGASAGGLLAGLGFAGHPLVAEAYSIALIDMAAICFSSVTVSLYLAIAEERSGEASGRRRWLAVPLGLALALACGSKMNAAVVGLLGLGVWAALGWQWLGRGRREAAAPWLNLAGGFAIALVLFFASNPSLYDNPFDGIYALLSEHAETARVQERMGLSFETLAGPYDRFVGLGELLFNSPVVLFLVLAAALRRLLAPRPRAHAGASSRRRIIAGWWMVAFVSLLAWMPFAWGRYALPLVPPTLLVAGTIADDLLRLVGRSRGLRGGFHGSGRLDQPLWS